MATRAGADTGSGTQRATGARGSHDLGCFGWELVGFAGFANEKDGRWVRERERREQRVSVIRATETQVLVAIIGKDLLLAAELVNELWNAKLNAEFGLNKRVRNHIDRAVESGIPLVVLVGESELNSGILKLKNIESHQEEMIPREIFVEELQKRLNMV
ncbi:hypothetical protein KFK09_016197 [Dendrobium nobile]|uniref:Anticodon-binding domain-containing protein n=1 Tax=Dendrobium nobile TaxID=94219 RepID=A0A8T3AYX6_DENNO|nr:hypothetical protein KFK09_016197 [Dendrobium nobile]